MRARVLALMDQHNIEDRVRAFTLHPWAPQATVIALILIVLWIIAPHGPARADIPYTTFVQQVRENNVMLVHMQGDQIEGVFKKPVSLAALTGNPGAGSMAYGEFSSLFPTGMTDPRLLPLLDDHGVTVIAERPGVNWLLWWRLVSLLPLLCLLIVSPYLAHRAREAQFNMRAMANSETPQRVDMIRSHPTFADIVGQQSAKDELRDVVELLQKPERFRILGSETPRAILLIGPSGSGKTLLAQAVAGEAHAPLYQLRASELGRPTDAIVSNPIRELFERARETAPAVILIDDLDALGNAGQQIGGRVSDPNLDQVLVELDSIDASFEVVVLGTTSRPGLVNSELVRRDRFGRRVSLGLPERSERVHILRAQARSLPLALPLAENVDLEEITRQTAGFSGADLALLINRAALLAARQDRSAVGKAEIEETMARLVNAGEVSTTLISKEQRRIAAYHEAGHAVLAMLLSGAQAMDRLSILPREETYRLPHYLPANGNRSLTKAHLLTSLTIMLGGRTAEELALGDATTGSEADLKTATQLAWRMVARWGMSDLGPVSIDLQDHGETDRHQPWRVNLSEATAAQIDRAVRVLLEDRHAVARHLLKTNRAVLDRLAELLSREETLDKEQVARLVTLPAAPAGQDKTNSNAR